MLSLTESMNNSLQIKTSEGKTKKVQKLKYSRIFKLLQTNFSYREKTFSTLKRREWDKLPSWEQQKTDMTIIIVFFCLHRKAINSIFSSVVRRWRLVVPLSLAHLKGPHANLTGPLHRHPTWFPVEPPPATGVRSSREKEGRTDGRGF